MSDVGTRMIDEWVRQNQFAHIEFRAFHGERQACIKDRLQVWQVIQVARGYEMDEAKTAEHLGLASQQVRIAIHYSEADPEEIDASIADSEALGFEQIKRQLSNARVFEFALPATEEAS